MPLLLANWQNVVAKTHPASFGWSNLALLLDKRVLKMKRVLNGNFPLGFAPENGPHQVSSFLCEIQEKAISCGHPRPYWRRKVANCYFLWSAVSMREAAKHILFEGFQAGCHVVLRGRRGTS